MKNLLLCLFFFPMLVAAQCHGSFEIFGAAGISDSPNNLPEGGFEQSPVVVGRFGFGASFHLGERTYLRTGMQFSQYGSRYALNSNALRWGTQHDGDGGFDPNQQTGETFPAFQISERLWYGEGFLSFRYQFKTWSPWQPFLEGGFAFGKYGTTVIRREEDGAEAEITAKKDPFFQDVAFMGRLGAGANYNFDEHVGIYGMAVLQQHIGSTYKMGDISQRPWQATLEVGVRIFVDPR